MTPLRIALASDWYLPRVGGLEVQMHDLAGALAKNGHVVDIITATPGPAQVNGRRIHRLDVGPLAPRWSIALRPKLVGEVRRVIDAGRYDLVHAHGVFSSLALTACRVAHQRNIPTVLTSHSVLGGPGAVWLGGLDTMIGWSRWPDVITAVSHPVARELAACIGRPVDVLHNGVDPAEWPRAGGERQPSIASVMRFARRKHPDRVVDAVPAIRRALPPSSPLHVTLVGDGHKRARVERQVRRLGLQDVVELTGALDRAAVKAVLQNARLFVLWSSQEALSIAILEALACGLPVVAIKTGGIGDIIRDGHEGFLVETRNDFATGAARILRDPVLWARMSDAALARVQAFSWSTVLEDHLRVYERALAARRERVSAAALT